jgi:large subunit ribosomal protein L21
MYAIVEQGGHQYRIAPGDRLVVDRLSAEVGSVVALQPVLFVEDGDSAVVGTPAVEGARVAALVVAHRLGNKLRVFKYKPKKRHRRTHGHRSRITELRIEALLGKGEPLPEAPVAAEKPPAAPRPARRRGAAGPTSEAAGPAAAPSAKESPHSQARSAGEGASTGKRPRRAPAAETAAPDEETTTAESAGSGEAGETRSRRSKKPPADDFTEV